MNQIKLLACAHAHAVHLQLTRITAPLYDHLNYASLRALPQECWPDCSATKQGQCQGHICDPYGS